MGKSRRGFEPAHDGRKSLPHKVNPIRRRRRVAFCKSSPRFEPATLEGLEVLVPLSFSDRSCQIPLRLLAKA
jgi:hypothetical protein